MIHLRLTIAAFVVLAACGADTGVLPRAAGQCIDFIAQRVAVVDQAPEGNILVRGNLPLITTGSDRTCLPVAQMHFAFEELNRALRSRLADFDLNDYELVDMTLIDNLGNIDLLRAESQAFGIALEDGIYAAHECRPHDDPSPYPPPERCSAWEPSKMFGGTLTTQGRSHSAVLLWWPVYGCESDECDRPGEAELGVHGFKLIDQPAYLHKLLTTSSPKRRLIYFHCMGGVDRTGTLHALYEMTRNQDLTLPEAFQISMHATEQVLVPTCVYASLARYWCLALHPGDETKCAMPECRRETNQR